MASSSDSKLYIALGVLVALGGGLYLQRQKAAEVEAAHSTDSVKALPKLEITEADTKAISKIVLTRPAQKDGEQESPAFDNVLVKEGESWKLSQPVAALANQSNVESLLKNLTTLSVKEQLPASDLKAAYAQYDLSDDKALHATFYVGDKAKYELWFGKSGGRGQMARIQGEDGVYLVDGYSSFLYARDAKGWRDLSILKFESESVVGVHIKNEHGEYDFTKDGDAWSAKFKKAKAPSAKALEGFDSGKLENLLRAYKTLNASGFGDGKQPADVGLAEPLASVVFELEDGAKRTLLFGSNAEGSSRWMKQADEEPIFAVSSWAADWAFAEPKKFEAGGEPATEEPTGEMPHGLPGME